MKVVSLAIFYFLSASVFSLEIDNWQFDKGVVCRISASERDLLNQDARWSGEGKPPLDISGVNRIFTEWVATRFESDISIFISSYGLHSFRAPSMETNVWVYIIEFTKFENGAPHSVFREKVAILMNGSILEPICE